MLVDPERIQESIAAIFGGVFYGLFNLAGILLQGQPPKTSDLIRAALNVAFGMMAGAIAAYFVGPGIAPIIPIQSMRDPQLVGFAIGAFAWVLSPYIFKIAENLAAKKEKELEK
jgi:hypothetical protein